MRVRACDSHNDINTDGSKKTIMRDDRMTVIRNTKLLSCRVLHQTLLARKAVDRRVAMQETAREHDPQLPMQQGISREVQVFA